MRYWDQRCRLDPNTKRRRTRSTLFEGRDATCAQFPWFVVSLFMIDPFRQASKGIPQASKGDYARIWDD